MNKLQLGKNAGLAFTGEYENGNPVFIGEKEQFKSYWNAIEEEKYEEAINSLGEKLSDEQKMILGYE